MSKSCRRERHATVFAKGNLSSSVASLPATHCLCHAPAAGFTKHLTHFSGRHLSPEQQLACATFTGSPKLYNTAHTQECFKRCTARNGEMLTIHEQINTAWLEGHECTGSSFPMPWKALWGTERQLQFAPAQISWKQGLVHHRAKWSVQLSSYIQQWQNT